MFSTPSLTGGYQQLSADTHRDMRQVSSSTAAAAAVPAKEQRIPVRTLKACMQGQPIE
jgi:hypothetical protein